MTKTDTGAWAVTWQLQGQREIADMPSWFEARAFAQICHLLVDCSDVHVLPPIGPLDSAVAVGVDFARTTPAAVGSVTN